MNHSCFKLLSDNSKVPGPPDAHSLSSNFYLFIFAVWHVLEFFLVSWT